MHRKANSTLRKYKNKPAKVHVDNGSIIILGLQFPPSVKMPSPSVADSPKIKWHTTTSSINSKALKTEHTICTSRVGKKPTKMRDAPYLANCASSTFSQEHSMHTPDTKKDISAQQFSELKIDERIQRKLQLNAPSPSRRLQSFRSSLATAPINQRGKVKIPSLNVEKEDVRDKHTKTDRPRAKNCPLNFNFCAPLEASSANYQRESSMPPPPNRQLKQPVTTKGYHSRCQACAKDRNSNALVIKKRVGSAVQMKTVKSSVGRDAEAGSLPFLTRADEITEVMDRLDKIEADHKIIFNRWKDVLHISGFGKGCDNNIFIPKEPEDILIQSPTNYVIQESHGSVMANMQDSDNHFDCEHQSKIQNCVNIPKFRLQAICHYQETLESYLHRKSQYMGRNFDAIIKIADNMLSNTISDVGQEITEIFHAWVNHVFDEEFTVTK